MNDLILCIGLIIGTFLINQPEHKVAKDALKSVSL